MSILVQCGTTGSTEVIASRNVRRAGTVRLVVPTAVRVEAGWSRRSPGAAAIHRLRVEDVPLSPEIADRAVEVRRNLGVSVADAHLGAAIATTPGPHAVVTSDGQDAHRIARHLDMPVTVVRI